MSDPHAVCSEIIEYLETTELDPMTSSTAEMT